MIKRDILFFRNDCEYKLALKEHKIPEDAFAIIPCEKSIYLPDRFEQKNEEPVKKERHGFCGLFESELDMEMYGGIPECGDWCIVTDKTRKWLFTGTFPIIFSNDEYAKWVIWVCRKRGVWTQTNWIYKNIDKDSYDFEYAKEIEVIQIFNLNGES